MGGHPGSTRVFTMLTLADVVDVVAQAGISRKVAQLKPIGVIKG